MLFSTFLTQQPTKLSKQNLKSFKKRDSFHLRKFKMNNQQRVLNKRRNNNLNNKLLVEDYLAVGLVVTVRQMIILMGKTIQIAKLVS